MLKRARNFLKAKDGLAAVEFALISPALVALLLGTIEVCNALECHQKVTMLASTAADLVSQESSVSSTDMTNIFNATTSIIYPFPENSTKIVISSIVSDGSGGGKVAWSVGHNTPGLTANSSFAAPAGMSTPVCTNGTCTFSPCAANACSVILAQVTYSYTSPLGKFILGTINMTDTFYAHPRKTSTITYSG